MRIWELMEKPTPDWWYTYPSEKYEFVNWDDDIPNISGKIKVMFQTTNQMFLLNHHFLGGKDVNE